MPPRGDPQPPVRRLACQGGTERMRRRPSPAEIAGRLVVQSVPPSSISAPYEVLSQVVRVDVTDADQCLSGGICAIPPERLASSQRSRSRRTVSSERTAASLSGMPAPSGSSVLFTTSPSAGGTGTGRP